MKNTFCAMTVGITSIMSLFLGAGCQQTPVDPQAGTSPLLRDVLPEEFIDLNRKIPYYRNGDTRDDMEAYLSISGLVRYEIQSAMSAECGAIDLQLDVQAVLRSVLDDGQEGTVYGKSSDFIFEPGIVTETITKRYIVTGMDTRVVLTLVFNINFESLSLKTMWAEEGTLNPVSAALEHQ